MIVEKVDAHMKSKIDMWPVRSNRASEAGHPCERYLVYLRTRWEERPLHDVGLEYIFAEGRSHEDLVLRTLAEAGIQVLEQQRPFTWDAYDITGHIDGKVVVDGQAVPLEIKSMSPFIFETISTVDDMLNGKYVYLRKYPAQMTLYLMMDEKELGLMLLKNKSTGRLKEIPVELDYDYAESIIRRIESVNGHVKANTVPDRIAWDEKLCGDCGFKHICMPIPDREELEFEPDEEFISKLDRRAELYPSVQEYNKLDKSVKTRLKNVRKLVAGRFLITGQEVERDGYTVNPTTYWKTTIKPMEE